MIFAPVRGFFIALTILVAGEPARAQVASTERRGPGIAARVNGEPITWYELKEAVTAWIQVRQRQIPAEALHEQLPAIRYLVLGELILDRLLLQRCDTDKIEASPQDVMRWVEFKIEQLSKSGVQIRNNDDYYRARMSETRETREEVDDKLKKEIRIQKLYSNVFKDRYVNPHELRAHYEAHRDKFTTNPIFVFRHLFIPDSEPDLGERLDKIDKALDEDVSFVRLVTAYSEGPRKELGGLFEKSEKQIQDLLNPLPQVIRTMEPGEVKRRIPTSQGIHYILLEKRVPGEQLSFEEAQEQIRQSLAQERRVRQARRFHDELRTQANVEIFLEDPNKEDSYGTDK